MNAQNKIGVVDAEWVDAQQKRARWVARGKLLVVAGFEFAKFAVSCFLVAALLIGFYVSAQAYITAIDAAGMHWRAWKSETAQGIVFADGWQISAPMDEVSLDDLIQKNAAIYKMPPALPKAVMRVESALNPWAKSHVGAKGLMQLMPETAKACGMRDAGEAYVPDRNIECGVYWLAKQIEAEGGDLTRGLERYNGGPRCVGKCPESIEYSRRVLRELARLG